MSIHKSSISFFEYIQSYCEKIGKGVEFQRLFDRFSVVDVEGSHHNVGKVVRAAWGAETAIPSALMNDIAAVVSKVLHKSDILGYQIPKCCKAHREALSGFFSDPGAFPKDNELLYVVGQVLWMQLPRARCTIPMRASGGKYICKVSRFVDLKYFIENHCYEVMLNISNTKDVMERFRNDFKPAIHEYARQSRLQNLIKKEKLVGVLGARPERNVRDFTRFKYCRERALFCIPNKYIETDMRDNAPDEVLGSLGLQFKPDRTYIEVVYEVPIAARKTSTKQGPAVPTIVDSEGYWLFRPDRKNLDKSDILWNMTRDIRTDGSGCPELVYGEVNVTDLKDAIVWPVNTRQCWSKLAKKILSGV